MKETMNQATVVMAKCRRSNQPYGIRMEKKRDGVWYCTWAFKLSERAAANEGYSGTLVSGRVDLDAEYQDVPTVVQWVGLAAALAENSLVIPVKLMSPVVGVICLVSVVRLRAST